MLDLVMQFLDNIWVGMAIAWEMGSVNAIYDQFVVYNQAYWSDGSLPSSQLIQDLSNRVQALTVVKEYCSDIDIVEMIKADIPFDRLKSFCNFPEGLNKEMASRFIQ